ncbi:deoxyribose-phosphate aldolase [Vibrio astriarenae]|nr:deoxyribose-phosphate aldolase [Vibrio sp. C7]
MMLEVIRDMKVADSVGFKPAGGVRTAEDAAQYLAMADDILGDNWVDARHYRLVRRAF